MAKCFALTLIIMIKARSSGLNQIYINWPQ